MILLDAVALPPELFTPQSMFTLAGATAATFVVANGLQQAFNFNPRWLGLAIAQVISFYGVFSNQGGGSDYFIAMVNGFLIYCAATGATQMASRPNPDSAIARGGDRNASRSAVPTRRTFFSPWF